MLLFSDTATRADPPDRSACRRRHGTRRETDTSAPGSQRAPAARPASFGKKLSCPTWKWRMIVQMSPRVSLGLPSVMSSLRMFTSFTCKRSGRVQAPHQRHPQSAGGHIPEHAVPRAPPRRARRRGADRQDPSAGREEGRIFHVSGTLHLEVLSQHSTALFRLARRSASSPKPRARVHNLIATDRRAWLKEDGRVL